VCILCPSDVSQLTQRKRRILSSLRNVFSVFERIRSNVDVGN
jgi:hypothetical protein